MGKKMVGILAAVLVFSVGVMNVSAHGAHHKSSHNRRAACTRYVDADGNGICDNCGLLQAAYL